MGKEVNLGEHGWMDEVSRDNRDNTEIIGR